MNNLTTLSKGAPYPLNIPSYEGAAAQFFIKSGFILQVMLPSAQSSEIKALRKGKIKAGFIRDESQILILFEIGDMLLECLFIPQIIPNNEYVVPDLKTQKSRFGIDMHVIDTNTNILKALRSFTLSPKLSRQLSQCTDEIRNQKFISFSSKLFNKDSVESLISKTEMHQCGVE